MINKRLREVRKTLKINQSDFALKIGMAQSGYSQIETGENTLTEQNIKLICLIYGVNETWLRTGKGEMFDPTAKPKDDDEKQLLEMFRLLSPEMRAFVLQKVQECLRLDRDFKQRP
jgi:transcriptional regulator with XRE-family HTH domain